jgi:hypothetical protein
MAAMKKVTSGWITTPSFVENLQLLLWEHMQWLNCWGIPLVTRGFKCFIKCGLYKLYKMQSAATCSRWFLARGFVYPEDEAMRSSETSVHTRSAQRHIPQDGILHSHRCENLKSYNIRVLRWSKSVVFLTWMILKRSEWTFHRYIFRLTTERRYRKCLISAYGLLKICCTEKNLSIFRYFRPWSSDLSMN